MLCSVVVLMTPLPVQSQDTVAANVPATRPRVGVVLGGGGAKGAAHIGVLKYLEEVGIPVDYVVGTSMGSIIGGLYAMGYTSEELAELIASLDWSLYMRNSVDRRNQAITLKQLSSHFVLTIPFGFGGANSQLEQFDSRVTHRRSLLSTLPSSFVGGSNLVNLFNNLCLGYQDSISFDSMPIPFACVASDLLTGDSAVLRSGSFATAIRSSMAIPGVFSPVSRDGRLLVDGGLVNNFPVDVCRRMGADIVIGIEVAEEVNKTPEQLQSLPQLLMQLMNVVIKGDREQNQQLCDLYIHPDVSGYNMLSFSHEAIDTLVARGYADARRFSAEFQAIKERVDVCGPVSRHLQAPPADNFIRDSVCLSKVHIKGIPESDVKWLMKRLDLTMARPICGADIEKAVNKIYGTGCYSDVTYTLHEVSTIGNADCNFPNAELYDWYELTFTLTEAEPHNLSIGFRYDNEESAAVAFGIGLNQNRLAGFKANIYTRLCYSPMLNIDISLGVRGVGSVHLAYKLENNTFDFRSLDDMLGAISFTKHTSSFYISELHQRNFSMSLGIDYQHLYIDRLLLDEAVSLPHGYPQSRYASFGAFVRFLYDTRDDHYFPRTGSFGQIDLDWRVPSPLREATFKKSYGSVLLAYNDHFTPGDGRVTISPKAYGRLILGEDPYALYSNVVGGPRQGRYLPQQLPFVSLASPKILQDMVAVLRLDFRWNFTGRHNIIALVNVIHSSDHIYDFLAFRGDDYNDCGVALGYAFQSAIGPIYIDIQRSLVRQAWWGNLSIGFDL